MGNFFLIVLAVAVGLVSGLGAVGLHHLIEGTHEFVAHLEHTFTPSYENSPFLVVLLPALGGLMAGSIVWLFARHDHSHGTSAVMEAVALHGGRLSLRPFLTKIFAAGLLIGAGGSAGPEDPSVQIGGATGSAIGSRFHLSVARINTLVTAGVASAIAAAFNAPIAGVFFALEVIAGDFSTTLFAPVVLAAVAGSIVGRSQLGDQPAFTVPPYELFNPLIETPLYVILGLITAFVGSGFIRTFYISESLFEKIPVSPPIRACLGGLLVGVIALWVPEALGTGYGVAGDILNGSGPMGYALLLLLFAKILATVITLGAVRVGGTFAPAMVLGAMVGGLFGHIVNVLIPGVTGPPAAYALVGMGATLTAVVRAPITAVLLLFEITGDYYIILAIMASVVSSHLLAQHLHTESVYTERLARKGIQLRFGRDVNILELVTVGEAMTPNFTTVPYDMPLSQLVLEFGRTRHHGFPVIEKDGRLFGMVTLTDLHRASQQDLPSKTPVHQITTRDLVVVYPEQSLTTALQQFAIADVGRIPVVDRNDPTRLLGVVRRSDIVKAYRRGAMQRSELENRRQQMSLGSQSGAQIVEVNVLPDGPLVGRQIRDINLPGQTIITSVLREGLAIIPRGDTVLHSGDHITILAMPEQVEQVHDMLIHGRDDSEPDTEPRYHQIVLKGKAPSVGKTVADLELPPDVLIVTLRRDEQVQAVHGDTTLEKGDEITILSSPDDLPAALRCLEGKTV